MTESFFFESVFGFAGREGGWAGLGCIFLLGWAGLGWAVGWWPGLGAGGAWPGLAGLGAGAGLEGAGYPDVVGLCSTRNPMGLKHLLGVFGSCRGRVCVLGVPSAA